jgi:hypothetical protein
MQPKALPAKLDSLNLSLGLCSCHVDVHIYECDRRIKLSLVCASRYSKASMCSGNLLIADISRQGATRSDVMQKVLASYGDVVSPPIPSFGCWTFLHR